jgi:error-prone DNA polymerase
MVSGLHATVAGRIQAARTQQPFASTAELAQRCALDTGDLKALAAADALHSLSGHRRQQVWDAAALHPAPALLQGAPVHEDALAFSPAQESEEVVLDYAATGLSLRSHPVAFLRPELTARKLLSAAQMRDLPHGRLVRTCGIVTMRQQPQTAKGVVFVTLEDETGSINLVVRPKTWESHYLVCKQSNAWLVHGTLESRQGVIHVLVSLIEDLSKSIGPLEIPSRDFR